LTDFNFDSMNLESISPKMFRDSVNIQVKERAFVSLLLNYIITYIYIIQIFAGFIFQRK